MAEKIFAFCILAYGFSGLFIALYYANKSEKNNKIVKMKLHKLNKQISSSDNNKKLFCVSAYLDRIEKAWIEILQESEKEPKTEFVLWLGLDGLRINDDGTSEWISRRDPKQLDTGVFSQPLNMQNAVHYGCGGGSGTGGTGGDGTVYLTVPDTGKLHDILKPKIDELYMQLQTIVLYEKEKNRRLIRMMRDCCCIERDIVVRDITGKIHYDFL